MRGKIIILVLIGLTFSFCTNSKNGSVTPEPVQLDKSFLALGDSYTIGEGVSFAEAFPALLIQKLKEKQLEYETPNVVAKTGWTTGELMEALEEANIQRNFDLVTLLIGVNNQYRGLSLEEYRTELRELLQRALIFASNKRENVRVISIPDWGVSPFASNRDRALISKEIDAFNAVKREETEALNILFIDITEISRTALNKDQYFAPDGLHFSKEMHLLWVEELLKTF